MDFTSKEYLHTIETLKEELHIFKEEQNKLRFQISNIFTENKKLTNELRKNVQERFQKLSESDVKLLKQNRDAAIEAKNSAIEMWQDALEELKRQEEQLMGKKSIVEIEHSESEKRLQKIKEDYTKGLSILSHELSQSRDELSKVRTELHDKNSQFEVCKTNLDSANKELYLCKNQISEFSDANQQLEEKIASFQSLMDDSSKTLDTLTREIHTLKDENGNLSTSVSELKEENKKLKSQILVFEKDAKECLLTAQEAVWHKKEIIQKEEQYQKEKEVLKSSIDLEVKKISMRYKAEIKEIQKKATEKTQSLLAEIQNLHQEIGEKQNMFERANREKQAVESKLELLLSESCTGLPISNSVFNDNCKRLTMVERARDELQLKVSSLEISLRELKCAKEQEIQYLIEKQNSLKDRTQTLSKDFNEASSDRVKFSDEVTKLRKRCYDLEKELKSARTKHVKDMSATEQESRNKLQALQEQLRLTEEHYKNVCNELQKLLHAEFKISNKWKAEVEDLISKSELKINELCQEISQLKHNNFELVNILHHNNVYVPRESIHLINIDSNA